MRRGDNAPIGQTCPMIDDVISTIDNAVEHVLAEVERIEDDELSDAISSHVASLHDLTRGRQSLMERIRSANDDLRTWAMSNTTSAKKRNPNGMRCKAGLTIWKARLPI